jgi:NADH-quinone oxidoreductase subunit M
VSVTGIVLAAVYVLWLYQRTMTGPAVPEDEGMRDLDRRELIAVVPLVAALVFFGFFPQPMLDAVNPTVDSLLQHVGVSDDPPTVPAAEHDDNTSEEGH